MEEEGDWAAAEEEVGGAEEEQKAVIHKVVMRTEILGLFDVFSFAQTKPFCECKQEPEATLIQDPTHKWLISCFPKPPRRRGRFFL